MGSAGYLVLKTLELAHMMSMFLEPQFLTFDHLYASNPVQKSTNATKNLALKGLRAPTQLEATSATARRDIDTIL